MAYKYILETTMQIVLIVQYNFCATILTKCNITVDKHYTGHAPLLAKSMELNLEALCSGFSKSMHHEIKVCIVKTKDIKNVQTT